MKEVKVALLQEAMCNLFGFGVSRKKKKPKPSKVSAS
jgi:hypothetical protein